MMKVRLRDELLEHLGDELIGHLGDELIGYLGHELSGSRWSSSELSLEPLRSTHEV